MNVGWVGTVETCQDGLDVTVKETTKNQLYSTVNLSFFSTHRDHPPYLGWSRVVTGWSWDGHASRKK